MDHTTTGKKLTEARKDRRALGVAGIIVFAMTAFLLYDSWTPEWRTYQTGFRQLVEEKFGADRASTVPLGLQQLYVKDLDKVDRCITCHLAYEWKGLESAPEPYRTHPREILEKHPVASFGCTSCHGGQGYATSPEDAHGLIRDWEAPLLGAELGDFYVLNDRKALLQIRCNTCHRYDRETKGAGFINRAKELVNLKGCRACHVINGRGGTVGPDLTWEGMKNPEQFNYERFKGFSSEFSWHVAHMKNPKELVPETVMPNFNFSSADAQAMAMLVMSWRKENIPVAYIPNNNFRDVPTREELEKEERMLKGPGSFFVKKNCFVCHAVSTLGIEAAAQIGPDLSVAVEDVQSRFGRTLDDFLARPTGTMEVVLSTMITLTPEEREEAISKLRMAFEIKQQQRKRDAQQAAQAARTSHR